jgi:hypothetical protein
MYRVAAESITERSLHKEVGLHALLCPFCARDPLKLDNGWGSGHNGDIPRVEAIMSTSVQRTCVLIWITVLVLSPAVLFGQASSESRPVVLHGADDTLWEVGVWNVTPRYRLYYSDKRYDVPGNLVELVNLDPEWRVVQAWDDKGAKEVYRDKLPPVSSEGPDGLPWLLRHWMLSLLFALLGFYAVFTVGLAGGPAGSGVLPFCLNLFHMAGFLWLAQGWAKGYFYSYLVIISGAMALSMYAIGAIEKTRRIRMIRAVMIGCYIAMFLIVNIKTYESMAFWSSRDMIQVYVPKHDRNKVEALTDKKEVIARFTLTKGIDCRTVIFWREEAKPGSLKIIPASRNPFVIPIKPDKPLRLF